MSLKGFFNGTQDNELGNFDHLKRNNDRTKKSEIYTDS